MQFTLHIISGYLCKKVLQVFNYDCCKKALTTTKTYSVSQGVVIKTRGRLIHPNINFFNLINHVEHCFAKYVTSPEVFNLTIEEVLSTYSFSFPCKEHASDLLSYVLQYYIRMMMRQYTWQEQQKTKKKFVSQKKGAKRQLT